MLIKKFFSNGYFAQMNNKLLKICQSIERFKTTSKIQKIPKATIINHGVQKQPG